MNCTRKIAKTALLSLITASSSISLLISNTNIKPANAQNTFCTPGEEIVSTAGPIQARVAGSSRRSRTDSQSVVFNPPPGYIIIDQNFQGIIDFGNTSKTISQVAPNSSFISIEELKSAYDSAIDLAVSLGKGKDYTGSLTEKYNQELKTLKSIQSSHQALELKASARGNGWFMGGSKIEYKLNVRLRCVGYKDANIIKESLLKTVRLDAQEGKSRFGESGINKNIEPQPQPQTQPQQPQQPQPQAKPEVEPEATPKPTLQPQRTPAEP